MKYITQFVDKKKYKSDWTQTVHIWSLKWETNVYNSLNYICCVSLWIHDFIFDFTASSSVWLTLNIDLSLLFVLHGQYPTCEK